MTKAPDDTGLWGLPYVGHTLRSVVEKKRGRLAQINVVHAATVWGKTSTVPFQTSGYLHWLNFRPDLRGSCCALDVFPAVTKTVDQRNCN